MGAVFTSDTEHPFEQLGPTDAGYRRGKGCVTVVGSLVNGVDRGVGNDLGTQLGVGREHAMEADPRPPRPGNPRGESLHELQW